MGMVSTQLIHGDCLEVMQGMEPNSIHSVICDPPYGLSFMGKDWDHGVPGVAFWEAALRVAKPGAMLLAFGGTRTFHRLTVAIEDAGWEIRDCLMWVYGSGFPKSHDISKAIDKAAGAEREVIGPKMRPDDRAMIDARTNGFNGSHEGWDRPWKHDRDSVERQASITAPATDAARQWDGWGTALKPAWEPIIMAMKPLDGTFANNALVHGVAGINIDGCRIEADEAYANAHYDLSPGNGLNGWGTGDSDGWAGMWHKRAKPSAQGRWPANLLLDESAAAALDQMSGTLTSGARNGVKRERISFGENGTFAERARDTGNNFLSSTGGASRYFARFAHDEDDAPSRMFYCAKASKRDRDEGLEGMELQPRGQTYGLNGGGTLPQQTPHKHEPQRNNHPTVKPTQLCRYLVRLVCPPGGTVLDPFCGSGSTGKAAVLEGFNFIGIDTEAEYLAIADPRIAHAQAQVKTLAQAQPALLEVA